MAAQFCSNCGKGVTQEDKFCPECGKSLILAALASEIPSDLDIGQPVSKPQHAQQVRYDRRGHRKLFFTGTAIALAWLLFVVLWLFFYASGFSIAQNVGILLLSLVVMAILGTLLVVPRVTKQPDWVSPPAKKP